MPVNLGPSPLKAFCQSDGTTSAPIGNSLNILSLTRSSAGLYLIVFKSPMLTANFTVTVTTSTGTTSVVYIVGVYSKTVNGFTVRTAVAGTLTDCSFAVLVHE